MKEAGMLGVGGATGAGNAANDGYHGSPGTVTLAASADHCCSIPLAAASRITAFHPTQPATDGARAINGSSAGPCSRPPLAVAAWIRTSTSPADCRYILKPKSMASMMPLKSPAYRSCALFWLSTSALEFETARNNAGGNGIGVPVELPLEPAAASAKLADAPAPIVEVIIWWPVACALSEIGR